jgi:glycerol-3-phosphate dehydrogenase
MTTSNKIHSDVLVVSSSINGAATACDAAGRNRSVCLAKMQNFAEGTWSRSLKLISGGPRYLKTYDLRIVGDALLG